MHIFSFMILAANNCFDVVCTVLFTLNIQQSKFWMSLCSDSHLVKGARKTCNSGGSVWPTNRPWSAAAQEVINFNCSTLYKKKCLYFTDCTFILWLCWLLFGFIGLLGFIFKQTKEGAKIFNISVWPKFRRRLLWWGCSKTPTVTGTRYAVNF